MGIFLRGCSENPRQTSGVFKLGAFARAVMKMNGKQAVGDGVEAGIKEAEDEQHVSQ